MNIEIEPRTGMEIEEPQFDAVVALGKNWRRTISGKVSEHLTEKVYKDNKGKVLLDWNSVPMIKRKYDIYLSLESKMTALAAGELYVSGKVGKIIFSTGETAGKDPTGKMYPTEAEEMKKFMRIFFPENLIPEQAIELETLSFDTAGNAEEVEKMLRNDSIKSVALLSVGSHLPRANRLFKNYGIKVERAFNSEEVLKNRNAHYNKLIRGYHQSKEYLVELGKEIIGAGLTYTIDPMGEKIRQRTLKTRHRE